MHGRYGDDGASPVPATIGYGELQRHMERGRELRAAALAEALARGGRLVQKLLGGGRVPGGRGRRRRVGPRHA